MVQEVTDYWAIKLFHLTPGKIMDKVFGIFQSKIKYVLKKVNGQSLVLFID